MRCARLPILRREVWPFETYHIPQYLPSFLYLNRRDQVIFSGLRTGHSFVTHSCFLFGQPPLSATIVSLLYPSNTFYSYAPSFITTAHSSFLLSISETSLPSIPSIPRESFSFLEDVASSLKSNSNLRLSRCLWPKLQKTARKIKKNKKNRIKN